MSSQPPPRAVEFYFDYLSPYAFLAHLHLLRLRSRFPDLVIDYRPTLFAGLLGYWGQLGPAEVPPKREWMAKDVARHASLHSFPIGYPKVHPFKPLMALRLSLKEVAGDLQERIVTALFKGAWGSPFLYDLGSTADLTALLTEAGIPSDTVSTLLSTASTARASTLLSDSTDRAIRERGVFGVPTMVVGGNLYWGKDNIPYVEMEVEGRAVLKGDKVIEGMWDKWKTLPRGTDRKGMDPGVRLKGKM